MAAADADVDINNLLQIRQGYLSKLGGGQEKGHKWNRRWFVLRDNVLMYFNSPKDFTGFRDKPSGVVLLEECSVREVAEDSNLGRSFCFVLTHANGESVVLAADAENEMLEWMQAVRTSRMCVSDTDAASMNETQRQAAAEADVDAAVKRRADAEAALVNLEGQLEKVHEAHRDIEVEKSKAERELKELMARFKLRKSLLHWRHRKLTFSFRALVTIVFGERIEAARRAKAVADTKIKAIEEEIESAVSARNKAEAAKRKSEEMFAKELELKKVGEGETKECEKLLEAETAKSAAVKAEAEQMGITAGAPPKRNRLDKEKEELIALRLQLERCKAESELLHHQVRRRAPVKS